MSTFVICAKHIKPLLALVVLSMATPLLYAQTPINDPNHYILDTYDNFSYFNSNMWNSVPNNTWGLEVYNSNNVIVSGGKLTLKCEKTGNVFVSGGIESVHKKSFSYGYFEIESKTPTSGNRGPWGGFWMQTGDGDNVWDEIDVLEPNGADTYYGTQYNIGVSANDSGGNHLAIAKKINNLPDLSADFHKYAVIWTPKHVQLLFDGDLVYEEVNPNFIPTHPMYVFLTFQIDRKGNAPDASTIFPLYWQFKNFKYYRLKTDCSISVVEDNFDFVNHDYKVYKSYSLSNSTIPNNTNVVLQARDYIILNGEFNVPLGSTLTMITHHGICPE
ncbi:MAG: hypothetical protein F083_1501 [bacterium F083]|nr:MAG: hypothetical protein F083_1501 [bacterium F083]